MTNNHMCQLCFFIDTPFINLLVAHDNPPSPVASTSKGDTTTAKDQRAVQKALEESSPKSTLHHNSSNEASINRKFNQTSHIGCCREYQFVNFSSTLKKE